MIRSMTNHESPPQLLTIHEAAAALHLRPDTLYKWSARGVNPQLFVRLRTTAGKRPRLRVDPVRFREYVHANTNGPVADR
jgi:hypothetical protein